MTAFSDELKTRRKQLRMSLDDVVAASGVSKTYIANIENAKPAPSSGSPPQPSRRVVTALAMALSWSIPDALKTAGYLPSKPGAEANELAYEPIQDGPDEIIVSTAGLPPLERVRLKKLILSYIESAPKVDDQLTTYGRRKE